LSEPLHQEATEKRTDYKKDEVCGDAHA